LQTSDDLYEACRIADGKRLVEAWMVSLSKQHGQMLALPTLTSEAHAMTMLKAVEHGWTGYAWV
jgi:hypothetical protein